MARARQFASIDAIVARMLFSKNAASGVRPSFPASGFPGRTPPTSPISGQRSAPGSERGLRGAVLAGEKDSFLAGAEQLRDEAAKANFPLRLEVERGLGPRSRSQGDPVIPTALDA